ncbi:MAG TPA: TIGR03619 family F420-dependent LLM class oxidoreductase [Mycobacteriales bacterium]|nr:TIGR03619 family F420-dependent LLM class oxidoreductase [Mycobacteriales bacterium]
MELGVALPTSGAWANPEALATVARRAEELGYRSLWTFQRLLYGGPPLDVSPATPDGSWPIVYRSVLDPLVSLGFAAAVTHRIRLGVAVVNGLFYSPAMLAKLFASLDVLSAGRLDAGVGLGWSRAEFEASGVPYPARGRRLDEFLRCLDAVLTAGDEPVEFDGEFYRLPPSHVGPGPVQRPRPPLLIGGNSPAAWRRAATLGDGWVTASAARLDGVATGVREVRRLAAEQGRQVRVVSRGVTRLRTGATAGDRPPLHGSVPQIRADLAAYAEAGVDEIFLDLNFDPEIGSPSADPVAALERLLGLLEELAPAG